MNPSKARVLRFVDSLFVSCVNFICLLYISSVQGVDATAFLALSSSLYLVFFSFVRQSHLNRIFFNEDEIEFEREVLGVYFKILFTFLLLFSLYLFLEIEYLSILVFFVCLSINSEFGRIIYRSGTPNLVRILSSIFIMIILLFSLIYKISNVDFILYFLSLISFLQNTSIFKWMKNPGISTGFFDFYKGIFNFSSLITVANQITVIHFPVLFLYFYSKSVLAAFYIGRAVFQGVQLYLKSAEFEIIDFVNRNKWCWAKFKEFNFGFLKFSLLYYFAFVFFYFIDFKYIGAISKVVIFQGFSDFAGLLFWLFVFQLISSIRSVEFYYFKNNKFLHLLLSSVGFVITFCFSIVFFGESIFDGLLLGSFCYFLSYSVYSTMLFSLFIKVKSI